MCIYILRVDVLQWLHSGLSVPANIGNQLDCHNHSVVWPNQSMIDCIMGSSDAIFLNSARERWDEGVLPAITPLGISIKICQMSMLFYIIADIVTLMISVVVKAIQYKIC